MLLPLKGSFFLQRICFNMAFTLCCIVLSVPPQYVAVRYGDGSVIMREAKALVICVAGVKIFP